MPMNPRLLRPTASGRFNPKSIAGLAIWLDATDRSTVLNSISPDTPATDTQTVRRWLDKSGGGNYAEQDTGANQPTIESAGMVFNGSNSRLVLPTAGAVSKDVPFLGVFAVLTWAALPTTIRAVMFFSRGDSTGSGRHFLFAGSVANRLSLLTRSADGAGSNTVSGTSDVPATRSIYAGIARYAAGTRELRLNGTNNGSSSPTAGNTSNTNSLAVTIGIGEGNFYHANFTLREILVYNAVMSSAQVEAVERYLAAKHGVTLA